MFASVSGWASTIMLFSSGSSSVRGCSLPCLGSKTMCISMLMRSIIKVQLNANASMYAPFSLHNRD